MFFLINLCPWWQHLITIHCTFTLTLSAYSLHNTSTVLVVMVKEMLLHHDFLQRVFYNEFPTFLLLFKLFQTTQLAEQQIVVHPLQYVFVTSIIQHAVKPYYCQNPSKVKNVFYVQNPWGKLQILCFCFFVFWAKTFTSILDTCTKSASLLSRLKTLHWHQLLWLGVRSSLNRKKNYTHTQTELRFWPLQRRHGVKKKKKKARGLCRR